MQQLLLKLKVDYGFSALMVTHDVVEAARVGDRAIVLAGTAGATFRDIPIDAKNPAMVQELLSSLSELRAIEPRRFWSSLHVWITHGGAARADDPEARRLTLGRRYCRDRHADAVSAGAAACSAAHRLLGHRHSAGSHRAYSKPADLEPSASRHSRSLSASEVQGGNFGIRGPG